MTALNEIYSIDNVCMYVFDCVCLCLCECLCVCESVSNSANADSAD